MLFYFIFSSTLVELLDLTMTTQTTPNTYRGKNKIPKIQTKQNVPRISLTPNCLTPPPTPAKIAGPSSAPSNFQFFEVMATPNSTRYGPVKNLVATIESSTKR